LARINELARKKRTVGLSDEEAAEQKNLYEIYLTAIRGQVEGLLQNIEFVDDPSQLEKKNRKILTQKNINLERVIH
jgi:uncharacterized protein YnzC (UPF0291/DUF896 family)